jgi:hypothetical protein
MRTHGDTRPGERGRGFDARKRTPLRACECSSPHPPKGGTYRHHGQADPRYFRQCIGCVRHRTSNSSGVRATVFIGSAWWMPQESVCVGWIAGATVLVDRAREGARRRRFGLLEVRNVRCSGLSRWGSKAGAHALTGKVTEGLVLIDEAVQIASRMGTFHVPNCSWSGRLAHCRQRRRRQQSFQRAFDDAGSGALRMTQCVQHIHRRLCDPGPDRSQGASRESAV